MPSKTEPRSGIQYNWSYGEDGWNVGMDENLLRLGRLGFHLSLDTVAGTEPPASPVEGDLYIVPASPSGAWAGRTPNDLTTWNGSAWEYYTPYEGWSGYHKTTGDYIIFNGVDWGSKIGNKILFDHVADADPHSQYITGAESNALITSNIDAHLAEEDPHEQYVLESLISQASGVASLDGSGNVPLSQLGNVPVNLLFLGNWDANTNTPTIVSGTGAENNYYIVSVAGTTLIDGADSWEPGDWVIFNGTEWIKVDNTDQVTSVNGFKGLVVLDHTDVGAEEAGVAATLLASHEALLDPHAQYTTDAEATALAIAEVAAHAAEIDPHPQYMTEAEVDTRLGQPIAFVEIAGGSIDGTTIGEASAAAGSFTNVFASGDIIVGGAVDGRDVASDGSKLDGIEAGADVTGAANVTAAGALMDSELINVTAVKALNQGVATTDSPSFAGLTATTAEINGGSIDGAVIGGSTAAAGSFTSVSATGLTVGLSEGDIVFESLDYQATHSDSGMVLTGGSAVRSAIFTEVNGQILSYAINMKQIHSGYDRFRAGAAFRLDMRANEGAEDVGNEHCFVVKARTAGEFVEFNGLVLDVNSGDTLLSPVKGNVGIGGNASPVAKCAIQSSDVTGLSSRILITNTDPAGSSGVAIVNTGSAFAGQPGYPTVSQATIMRSGSGNTGGMHFWADSPTPIVWYTNGAERMRITSEGNVGIGTDDPIGNFQVKSLSDSIIQVTSSDTGIAGIDLGNQTSVDAGKIRYDNATSGMSFSTSGTDKMTINAAGLLTLHQGDIVMSATSTEDRSINVGSGRAGNGVSYIDLIGDPTYADYGLRLLRGAGENAVSSLLTRGTGGLNLRVQEAGPIRFFTSNVERMALNAEGDLSLNVGSVSIGLANSGVSRLWIKQELNTSTTGANGLRVTDADSGIFGAFGIGADDYLDISASSEPNAGTSAGISFNTLNNGALSEKLRIEANGFVGINTASPEANLDVNGDIIAGGIYLGGTGAANYLDDYEEGSLTWTIQKSDGSVANLNVRQLGYVKVGNLVHISGYIRFDNNTGSDAGNIQINGTLPFVPNHNGGLPVTHIRSEADGLDTYMMSVMFDNNSSGIRLNISDHNYITNSPVGSAIQTNIVLQFSGTYRTDS